MRQRKYRAWDGKNMHELEVGQCLFENDFVLRAGKIDDGEYIDDKVYTLTSPLMDCTFKPDRLGKQVYEGDIIYLSGSTYTIIYDEDMCRFIGKSVELVLHPDKFVYGVVIGNIYENHELIPK